MSDSPMTSYLQRNPKDQGLSELGASTGPLQSAEENDHGRNEQDAIAATLDHVPTGESAEDEEDSVEEYMAEFLKRYKIASGSLETAGGQGSADVRALSLETTKFSGHKPSPERAQECSAPAAVARPSKTRTPVDRTVAPESPDAMHALRQLANSSARGALETHSSRQLIISLYTQLLSSVVAMFCCLAFVAMAARFQSLSYVCAVVSLVVAAVFCRRFLALIRQLPSSPRTLTTPR